MNAPDGIARTEAPEASSPDNETMIALLRTLGAAQFDPVRFRYIEVLAKRADAYQGSVRCMLDNKLSQVLATFKDRLEMTRREAGETVARSAERFPHASDELQRLLAAGDVKGMRRLAAELERPGNGASLGSLVHRLEQAIPQEPGARSGVNPGSRSELKTIRNFRRTWSKLSVDNQVTKALKHAPKNAGPINSHMLVLRSLAMMRDISPDYLNRFISYAETLLCLDQGEPEKPANPKKPSAKGAKK